MEQKVLLVGAHGQLGRALQALKPPHWAITALGSAQLDITDAQAVHNQVHALHPTLIINAAAYNAVDRAEHERDRAFAINAHGPLNLARAANKVGARLVHVSTDYVFDGHISRPYTERDTPNPLNVYGESKLQGEHWVLEAQPQALILRTAWVYSAVGANFVAAMLNAAKRGRPLRVVNDQTGTPTFAGDLADAIIGLAEHPQASGGLYHYSGATALTRYEFARAILEAADRIQGVSAAAGRLEPAVLSRGVPAAAEQRQRSYLELLSPIASSDYPSDARRPHYSVLDCSKMARLGFPPKPLQQSLPNVVAELITLSNTSH